ncbi:SpoIIE family protein phosphatase [Streptomyces sp. NEAU-YJ-81]|uniref:SpoIIE family protein phosphatase n=1 Tax=Streptomyces sp. NEAU-YJ-81 TaxID=2820288 RepID=UPI001ABD191D|nr:SpoIIE family protein phosphatase [Streptomyces sp. NEAU-YJ-81]MBO3682087.1 SpoIIE family protein phosphatase [Streptomyces sp. NEAU-YJ-81]
MNGDMRTGGHPASGAHAQVERIDAVLFDIGGTIYDDERFVRALYRAIRELAGDVDEAEFWSLYDIERGSGGTALRTAFARRFVPGGDAALLHQHIVRHWEYPAEALYPDVRPTLEALARQYRLGILGNHPAQVREALRRDGLDGLFDAVVLGGVDTVEKPDPRAFRTVLDRVGVSAAQALYVGNRLDTDIRGSARVGLRKVWMLRGEAPPAPTADQLAEPDAVITSLTGLPIVLARLSNRPVPAAARVRGVSTAALDIAGQYRVRQRFAIVNAASVRIGTTLGVARTAEELADVATEQFADFVTVDLLEGLFRGTESELTPVGGHVVLCRAAQHSVLDGCPESVVEPGQTDRYSEGSPMSRALSTASPSRHWMEDQDIQRWLSRDPVRAQAIRRYRLHSLIVAPLLARGTLLGIVQFFRHQTPDTFDAEDLLLAEEITARAALSIDNARRYTRERNTALALQRSMLLQQAPRQAAVEVASRYLPTGSRAGVGGDWFDVIPLSGARVALVVGDVVGRGIQASATMGRLRTAVLTLADIDIPPDELLTHLDDLVLRLDRGEEEEAPSCKEADRGAEVIGATCLYAVYDPVSRRCTLARAGHPGPVVVQPDGATDFPDLPPGPPLGLGGLPFESAELELPEGSLIALYTNGLIGSADRDLGTGIERLRRALACAASSLEETCNNVLHALLPDTPADDVALLLARTRGLDASQVATWDLPSDPAVVARARQMAMDRLTAWGLDEAAFVTELVVSELVTNAIRHARPPIQLRLIHDSCLTCEVSDASSTSPHMRRARTFDEDGRGLLLVAQLTQRWGTRHAAGRKTIWTEQALSHGRP